MKKKLLKFSCLCISVFAIFMVGCEGFLIWLYDSCADEDRGLWREIDGVIYYYAFTQDTDTDYVTVCGISDKLKKEKEVVIPKTVYFKKAYHRVIGFGTQPLYAQHSLISDKLERIYIYNNYLNGDEDFLGVPNLKKIFVFDAVSNSEEAYFGVYLYDFMINDNSINTFVVFEKYKKFNAEQAKDFKVYMPNVTYMLNYDGAENKGYYFIDEREIGEKLKVIDNPKRDGYKFLGWYKEKECINVWDFTNDTNQCPTELKDVENYNPTTLYAKWVKE